MSASTTVTRPAMRPYLTETAAFASGKSNPRDFLERCLSDLEIWEPKIGAFVALNLGAARDAADASTARWRAGKPLSPIDGSQISRSLRQRSRKSRGLDLPAAKPAVSVR